MINSSAVVTNARKCLTRKFQQSDESDEDVNDYTDEDVRKPIGAIEKKIF